MVFENVALAEGENTVCARSGDVVSNTIRLNAVAEHNYAYDLPEGNQAANWFDDPEAIAARKALKYPKGYYSIKDKMGTLLANPQTAAILGGLMSKMAQRAGAGMIDAGKMGEEMQQFMNMMRLCDMLKMAGDKVPAEAKIALNEALTKIKK